jgi:TolB protein
MAGGRRGFTPSRGAAALALALVLILADGCTGSRDRPGAPDPSDGQTTGAGTNGDASGQTADIDEPEAGLYRIDLATGETEPILTGAREPRDPERSPDGSRLAYVADGPNGLPQIFLLEDGRSRRLTDLPGGASDPTWSPDGTRIAFAGARTKGGDSDIFVGDSDIFVVGVDGSHVRMIAGTDGYDRRPDWSPDGSRIVFDNYGEIWVATVDDGTLTRLPLTPLPGSSDRWGHGYPADPTWSRDGRWIAFTRFDPHTINAIVHIVRLWIVRSNGTDERPLPTHETREFWYWQLDPSWSPDGSAIAFASTRRGGFSHANVGIGIVDARTGEVEYLPIPVWAWDLSWDADGLIASVAGHMRPSPPYRGVTVGSTQDPWPTPASG